MPVGSEFRSRATEISRECINRARSFSLANGVLRGGQLDIDVTGVLCPSLRLARSRCVQIIRQFYPSFNTKPNLRVPQVGAEANCPNLPHVYYLLSRMENSPMLNM